MKKLNYYVLDVFTSELYKGNPLSVVCIDDELDIQQYHDISREFGYSETSFVKFSAEDKALHIRSFTPAKIEVIGAGHNLLGAVCLALLKKWPIFKNQGGQSWVFMADASITVKITEKDGLPYVAMRQKPAELIKSVPAEVMANALGLNPEDLELNNWESKVVQTEVAHVMVPVKNLVLLNKAVSNKVLLKEASQIFGFEGCYLFTTSGIPIDYLAETRFFNPGIGIEEDPATGTAAGPLTGYLEQMGHITRNQNIRILQGEQMDQPSVIHTYVAEDGIWVSGSSVITMEGQLYL
jgi:trans-2,3-dihydro-3-hydroxyanthranilate isomerase